MEKTAVFGRTLLVEVRIFSIRCGFRRYLAVIEYLMGRGRSAVETLEKIESPRMRARAGMELAREAILKMNLTD